MGVTLEVSGLVTHFQTERGAVRAVERVDTHDLRGMRHMSDRIAIMYLGKIVEHGDAESAGRHPVRPYTKRPLFPPFRLSIRHRRANA